MSSLTVLTDEKDAGEDARYEVGRLFDWLRDIVWPLWIEKGVDWKGSGFHEHLDRLEFSCDANFRRLRVVTRQIYVFSVAARENVPGAQDAVELGIGFLRRNRNSDGSYPWRFDLDGRVIDKTRDLYDHAFVLLAFASAANDSNKKVMAAEARLTLDFILGKLRHPRGGFHESAPVALPRRQNPHMHLLEAAIAAFEAFADDAYLDLAAELVRLFGSQLFQHDTGALPEYFDDALKPIQEHGHFIVEPGHHYEWAWLLDRYEVACRNRGKRSNPQLKTISSQLLRFADMHGLSPQTGLVVNEVGSDGRSRDSSLRLWPQSERIKCEARRAGTSPSASSGIAALWTMIGDSADGLWNERLSADGNAIPGNVPASSLYHLTCAIVDSRVRLQQ